jgi:hypothetical protein
MKNCDNCGNCVPHNPFIPICEQCVYVETAEGKTPSNWKPLPMTNADRIRAMTDEELEAFLIDVDLDKAGSPFITEWGKWLQQPAEGDA